MYDTYKATETVKSYAESEIKVHFYRLNESKNVSGTPAPLDAVLAKQTSGKYIEVLSKHN